MLIDSDVLIWYLRGNQQAQKAIDQIPGFLISVVSYIELIQGMRDNTELGHLRRFLRNHKATVVYINEKISAQALLYVEHHFLSHSLELADALIAATAVASAEPLLTGNIKHYRIIKDLELCAFKP